VVEDNELNQKLLVQMLNNYGFEVATANNGLECLNMLPHQEFDVILMDMQMPLWMVMKQPNHTQRKHLGPYTGYSHNRQRHAGDREKCLASVVLRIWPSLLNLRIWYRK
jgi:CheY-like chemotaxis protein